MRATSNVSCSVEHFLKEHSCHRCKRTFLQYRQGLGIGPSHFSTMKECLIQQQENQDEMLSACQSIVKVSVCWLMAHSPVQYASIVLLGL